MFKKILLVTALVASASCNLGQVPGSRPEQGQVKLGASYGIKDQWRNLDPNSVPATPSSRASKSWVRFRTASGGEWDGDDRGDGLGDATIGVRYFFPMNLGLFLDVELPIGDDSYAYQGWGFHFGAQYAKVPLIDKISMGSELGFTLYTEGDDDYSYNRGTDMNLGVEFDYDLGAFCRMSASITTTASRNPEQDCVADSSGKASGTCKLNDDNSGYATTFGVNYSINQMMTPKESTLSAPVATSAITTIPLLRISTSTSKLEADFLQKKRPQGRFFFMRENHRVLFRL